MIESFKNSVIKFVITYFLEKNLCMEAFEVEMNKYPSGDYHF